MTVMIDGVDYVTAATAAQILATTELKILMLLRQKRLSGDVVEGVWHVTSDSVTAYHPDASEQATPGRCHATCGACTC